MKTKYPLEAQKSKSKFGRFQREDWQIRAQLDGLKAVLDPCDPSDLMNRYHDYFHKLALSKHIDFQKMKRAVDFGCGIGRITHWIARKIECVIGIDITLGMLDKAKNKIEHKNIYFINYDGERIPIRSGSIDLVISVYVLQHIVSIDDLNKIISEMKRILTDNGQVCIIEQVSKSPKAYGMPYDFVNQRLPKEYETLFRKYGLALKNWEIVFVEEKGRMIRAILKRIQKHPELYKKFLLKILSMVDYRFSQSRALTNNIHVDGLFVFEKA